MNSSDWQQRALTEMNNKTKPLGALGELENLAIQIATIQKTLKPNVYPARVLVFGGDHGVAGKGVSAYPAEVTAQMMANFAAGGAAINAVCHAVNADLKVIDVGVNADLTSFNTIIDEKVGLATNDISETVAMSECQYKQALGVGQKQAETAFKDGYKTLALGEMGIGNTTSAAALICAFTGHNAEDIVGVGTGIDEQTKTHKCRVVEQAVDLHLAVSREPSYLLQALGGYEIVAISGAILKASALNLLVVIDGFISTAAALAACAMDANVQARLIFSHQSAENGHQRALAYLGAKPLLNLGLRLGEGSGAALSLPLLHSAATVLSEMATFEQAGVSTKD